MTSERTEIEAAARAVETCPAFQALLMDGNIMYPAKIAADIAHAALAPSLARIAELEAVLRCIADGDEPRPVAEIYRNDGKHSKHDRCSHGHWMYESCGECIGDYARRALREVGHV